MNNDSNLQQLRETGWRRALSDAKVAELRTRLAAQPELLAQWQEERQLTRALGRLPDAPVPSNFTARVLQAVENSAAAEARARTPAGRGWWHYQRWLPRLAVATLVLGVSLFSVHRYQAANRARIAQSVAAFSEAAALPSPEVLQDFDTISRLGSAPAADEELLELCSN